MVYQSLQQLKDDVISMGLKFAITETLVTDKQIQKADTAYWWPRKFIPYHVQMKAPGDGLLMFGNKSMALVFGARCDLEKPGLKGFLFRSIKCGICADYALVGSNGCCLCGFLICAVCEMKLGLVNCSIAFPMTEIACAQCRNKYSYSVLPSLNDILADMDKFNDDEKKKLQIIVARHQETIARYGRSATSTKKSLSHNQILKDKLDMSKCASCKTKFVSKRSNCGGCGKVSYCNGKCQRAHWAEHKKDCNLFKTYDDGHAQ